MIKSPVSFFRKHLKIKGRTEHNGRGAWEMDFDCTVDELRQRAVVLARKLESEGRATVAVTNEMVDITLNANECEGDTYYRRLIMREVAYSKLIVVMAFE